ncbi:Histidine kinase-, DNA gyrase B-, and HSP90-like ATPase [Paenibacillus sp. 1_12]|uniref:hybrid sensor histidine kinase/response regulator n=1 Tax=Paenibacillus sp. 1_12 TaxID=1566278 RepID=UPI0008E812C1|nr:ATP-binding protein [Paenibacillus sp. 1_12]SFL93375.1 Histidine kinase-, DNA gyrase B-, and HSP90-like ATPase [Paenibacillus sp. 1_12]
MKKYGFFLILGIIFITLLPLYGIIRNMESFDNNPQAVKGRLDLNTWSFAADGPVQLTGEWEFYRNQLLTPADFTESTNADKPKPVQTGIVSVPGKWNDYMNEEKYQSNADGAGTYRLRLVLNNKESDIYGIRTVNIRMANRLFVNGQLIGASGIPGLTPETSTSNNVPYIRLFSVNGNVVEIVVQISNFSYASGGMIYPLLFGDQTSILKNREHHIFGYLLTTAGFLILSLYFLLLFRLRKRESSLLYLGAFCFWCLIYVLTHGEKLILAELPFIPYELVMKIQLMSSTFIYYCLILYTVCLFPRFHHRALMPWMKVIVCLMTLVAIFLPSRLFSEWEIIYYVFGFISVGYVIYLMLKGLKLREDNSLAILAGLQSILMMLAINLLYIFGSLEDYIFFPYEILVFIFAQALLLAKRFSNLFNKVEQLSRRLLTLDEMKDEFMASTSHELRTPLHGIVNMADSLLAGVAGPLNAVQVKHLSMIVATGQRLKFLINDILDFNKLKNGQLQLQRQKVNLPSVVQSVLEVVDHVRDGKNIRFVQQWPDNLPMLDTDEDRLRQILYNLLGNAVKFTQEGEIRIYAEAVGSEVKISVADTGKGIAKDRLNEIFNPYVELAAGDSQAYTGTGLGLHITKKLIELGGGKVAVESEPGLGSLFYFTLPAASGKPDRVQRMPQQVVSAEVSAAAERVVQGVSPSEFTNGTVLIVDDDPVNLQVLINLLTLDHYRVLAANHGAEAMELMSRNPQIDLVITDWMMPGLSGLELCKVIRERYLLSELPVLILTARSRPEEIVAGFRAGVNDFLTKPVDAGELRARVRTLLELRQSVQTLISTEMAFLQAQIKPHFLYNALNTIMAICRLDPNKTMQLLLELSRYLRSSFDFQNRDQLVPLDKELELVQAYLLLEKARFEERLEVEYDIVEQGYIMIPPLCIQPIVENAVRHGIMQRAAGGKVQITVQSQETGIKVIVTDNGVGIPPEQLAAILMDNSSGGVGLKNIHKRLLMLYGKGLQVESKWKQGTTVSFEVPLFQNNDVSDTDQ